MSIAARRMIRRVANPVGNSSDIPTLQKTVLVSNLSNPWEMAFVSDGTMFFTQRGGTLSVRETNGTVRQVTAISEVVANGEGGLMGLALDPNFASNRYIYMALSSNFSGSTDNRVVRWTINAAYTTLSSRTDIVTGISYSTGRHSGCRIKFGPDGYLWIGTGDAAIGTAPQSTTVLGGKVLRVDRDGNAAPGNAGGSFDARIYSYGHRNVQGLMFRPSDGQAFNVEHGTDRDDEVNKLIAGANYGYNPVPGYNESVPMTDTTLYPSAVVATWTSGNPTIAPSGGTFLSGTQWKDWNGYAAVAVLKDRHLMIMQLSSNGTTTLSTQKVLDAEGYRLRSAVQGPDGNLYISTDNGSGDQIWRVTPS